jgi:nucleoside-diphosphate-sugar epimerase
VGHVIVTGGSGKAGRAVIRELLDHGIGVVNVDTAPPADAQCHFIRADLTDFGQAVETFRIGAGTVDRRRSPLGQATAVIHLAGIPAPGITADSVTFRNNLMSTYAVFTAATSLGIDRIVWASSETTYGLPLTRSPPDFAPITEEHPLKPESAYALAKSMCEDMAAEMARWHPGTRFVALRISNIFEPGDYAAIPSFWDDPDLRRWNLWSWVDARDVGQICRLALAADLVGHEAFTVAAADTLMTTPSRTLMERCFPGVPVREGIGEFETLLDIGKARRLLGYAPRFTWREGSATSSTGSA